MNDAAVKALWAKLDEMYHHVLVLERKVEFLRGQVKARLREEAEARELSVPRIPKYPGDSWSVTDD